MIASIKGNSISYLRNICEKKLREYFPAGVPAEVNNRLEKELSYIDKAGDADVWRIYYEFNETARKCNSIIGVRTSRGNSIVTFLLGYAPIDPMEPYYYCKKCGRYEKMQARTFGIDAEDKKCPSCGENLSKRGFDLPEVFTWGNQDVLMSGEFLYDYPGCLRAFLFSKLNELYPDNEVIPVYDNFDDYYHDGEVKDSLAAFTVLPDETDAKDDFAEFVSYTEKGEIAFSGDKYEMEKRGIIFIPLFELDILNKIMEMQEKTGTFFTELDGRKKFIPRDFVNTGLLSEEEKTAMSQLNKASIFEIIELLGIAHNTFTFSDEEDIEDRYQINKDVLRDDKYELPVNKRFFTRETLYEELLLMDLNSDDAYNVTQFVRKGKASARKDQWKAMCEKYNLPKDFTTFCEGYKYMWPRFTALERTYLLSICIEYLEKYPELYFETSDEKMSAH